MHKATLRLSVWLAALTLTLVAGGGASAAASLPSCAPQAAMVSRFDAGRPPEAGFTRTQIQRGSIETAPDPSGSGNQVARMTAERKRSGQVGKSDLILAYAPLGAGRTIEMGGRFFFPAGSQLDSVILMDLECASCGLDTNPGVRLYLREGLLRVDRSKIGIKEAFTPDSRLAVRTGKWHDIRWQVTLGIGNAGRSQVFLDGKKVMDAVGTTLLSQAVVSNISRLTVKEQVDRFQVGLTANSNSSQQTLYLDDVSICVR